MEVVFLFALVFLTIMLRVGKDRQKQKPKKKKKKKNQGQIASNRVREKTTIENINLHDT